jgi:hypothetical protein
LARTDLDEREFGRMISELNGMDKSLIEAQITTATQAGRVPHPGLGVARHEITRAEAPPPRSKTGAMGLLRATNQLGKISLLFSKGPGYVIPQHPGLMFMLANGLGGSAPTALLRSAMRMFRSKNPSVTRGLEAGSGAAGGFVRSLDLGNGPFQALNNISSKLGAFYSRFMDDIYRKSFTASHLAKLGIKSEDEAAAFFAKAADPSTREAWTLFAIRQAAQESFGNFSKMPDWERRWIADWVFFYPWIRASTRYAARMPVDHPIKFAMVQEAGGFASEHAETEMEQFFVANGVPAAEAKVLTEELRKMAPGIFMTSGEKDAKAITPQQLSVLQGPYDWMELAGKMGLIGPEDINGDDAWKALLNFGSTPAVQLVGAAANYDTFSGHPYPQDMGMTDRLLQEGKSLNPWSTMAVREGWLGNEKDQGSLYTYTPQEAILNPTLSSATPRGVNVQGVRDVVEGNTDRELSPGGRRHKNVQDVRNLWVSELKKSPGAGPLLRNGRLSPQIREAFNRYAEIRTNEAGVIASSDYNQVEGSSAETVTGRKRKLTRQVELFVKWKIINPSVGKQLIEQFGKIKDKEALDKFRDSVLQPLHNIAYGNLLRQTQDIIRQMGGKIPSYNESADAVE